MDYTITGVDEKMTNLELIQVNAKAADSASDAIFELAEMEFKKRDKDEMTTTLKLLTDIGMCAAAIKISYGKIKTMIDIINDLEGEENG